MKRKYKCKARCKWCGDLLTHEHKSELAGYVRRPIYNSYWKEWTTIVREVRGKFCDSACRISYMNNEYIKYGYDVDLR